MNLVKMAQQRKKAVDDSFLPSVLAWLRQSCNSWLLVAGRDPPAFGAPRFKSCGRSLQARLTGPQRICPKGQQLLPGKSWPNFLLHMCREEQSPATSAYQVSTLSTGMVLGTSSSSLEPHLLRYYVYCALLCGKADSGLTPHRIPDFFCIPWHVTCLSLRDD